MKTLQLFRLLLAAVVLMALALANAPRPVQAATSGSDLVAAVNTLRQSKGLAALAVDPALMKSAQAHSEYQASIGSFTHTGLGGSTPTSRGIAAGFGGGFPVFVSENVAFDTQAADLSYLLNSVWSDALHWDTMLDPHYTRAGAGVAVSGSYAYYTLDVGYIIEPAGSAPAAPILQQTLAPLQTVTSPPTLKGADATIAPIITSTPRADGSVYHVVQYGQFLISIAQAYGLTLDQLRTLNAMGSSDVLYAGQKLLVRVSSTPGPTATKTTTPAPPTRTPLPTYTPSSTPSITPTASATATATPKPFLPSLDEVNRDTLGKVILGISAVGLLLVVFSLFRKK